MPALSVFLGATSRVAQLVVAHWPSDTLTGGSLLRVCRNGSETGAMAWDMTTPPPPLPHAPRVGAVFCFAGVTPKSGGDLWHNGPLALAAVESARAWGAAHCFVMSSAAVYGNPGPVAVDEAAVPCPLAPYGEAKLAMEQAVLATRPRDVTVLRLANIAGAGEPFDSAARPEPESLPLHRFADGTGPVRSFISGRALARVLVRLGDLASQGHPLPPVLNVAAPRPTAMADILSAMNRRWHWCKAPETAIQTVHLDTTRLAALCALPDDWASARHLVADLQKDTAAR